MAIPLIVAALAEKGLGMLANAVFAKGQKVVEEKLGVKLSPDMTGAEVVELRGLEFKHNEWLIEASLRERQQEVDFQKTQEDNITARWNADATSDTWMAQNIRPSVLVYILIAYTLLAMMSAFGLRVEESYVLLLGNWGTVVMTAYFGGRSIEKIVKIRQGGK